MKFLFQSTVRLFVAARFHLMTFLMVSLFASSSLAYDANFTKVEVTGRAAISDNKSQKARKYALEDALYMAALKAGADITGTAITSKGVLIRDVLKLSTKGQLVDFNIMNEKNTGSHYEVKLQAFFAQKKNETCRNPRHPSIKVMSPQIKISANVDVTQIPIAEFVSSIILDSLVKYYPGSISKSRYKLSEVMDANNTQSSLFDYQSLQTGGSPKVDINEDFILNVSVHAKVKNNKLQSRVKLFLLARNEAYAGLELEEIFTSQLPAKFPVRSLSVLWPKILKVAPDKMFDLVNRLENHLKTIACAPLEAKTVFSSGRLKIGIGSISGIKKGAIAYVTSGRESWTLLEVSNVTKTSSTLKPINTMSNPETLANLTVRIIEGAL